MPRIRFASPFAGVDMESDPRILPPAYGRRVENVSLDRGRLDTSPQFDILHSLGTAGISGLHLFYKPAPPLTPLSPLGIPVLIATVGGQDVYKIQDQIASLIPKDDPNIQFGSSPFSFKTFQGRAYFVGNGKPFVTDTERIFEAQIRRPATAPSVALAAGTSNMRGQYDYKYTFFSTSFQQESPSSDASALILVEGTPVMLSNLETGATLADSRVDKRRIYRRKASINEVLWSLVAEIDATVANYTDSLLDQNVDAETIAPLSFSQEVPDFRFIESQGGILMFAGDREFPNRVYVTRPDKPWVIDDFVAIGSDSDSDPIIGLHAFGGITYVYKRASIWTLSGNSSDSFFTRRAHSGIGCRSHFSIVSNDAVMFFLADEGFYAYSGSGEPLEISGPIRPELRRRRKEVDQYVYGIHDQRLGAILWSIPDRIITGQFNESNSMAAYFYRNSRRVEAPSWALWRTAKVGIMARAELEEANPQIAYGTTDSRVGRINFQSSVDFDAVWETGIIDAGEPERFKAWGVVEVNVEPGFNAVGIENELGTLEVFYSVDGKPFVSLGTLEFLVDHVFRKRINRSSREIVLRFEFGTNAVGDEVGEPAASITSWTLAYELRGRV